MPFSLIYFFAPVSIFYILHNYVIPQAMPHAIPQTHSAFHPHRSGCTRYYKSSQQGYKAVSWLSKYMEVFIPVILPSPWSSTSARSRPKSFQASTSFVCILFNFFFFFFFNTASPCFNSGSLFHLPSARFSSA